MALRPTISLYEIDPQNAKQSKLQIFSNFGRLLYIIRFSNLPITHVAWHQLFVLKTKLHQKTLKLSYLVRSQTASKIFKVEIPCSITNCMAIFKVELPCSITNCRKWKVRSRRRKFSLLLRSLNVAKSANRSNVFHRESGWTKKIYFSNLSKDVSVSFGYTFKRKTCKVNGVHSRCPKTERSV